MSVLGEASSSTFKSPQSAVDKGMEDMAFAVLTELRLEGKLCDVVIKVSDVEFDAHKIILCSCSSYFRTLFTGAWATSQKQIYTIPGVSPEMMHLIINYAYNHSVLLTKDNVVDALAAADQFLIPGIVQTCCFFLEGQLCPRNCVGIWRIVDFYHCPELRAKVFLYILQHFEKIASVSQEFLELTVPQLCVIIENDRLVVKKENAVYEAVVRWIKHLPRQREGFLSVLLPKVRLGLLTASYLQNNVIDSALVKSSFDCMSIVNEAVMALTEFRFNGSSNSHSLNRPRLPSAILLVTGGKDDSVAATSLEAYDSKADCWVTVGAEEIWRAHHGAAVLNNFVYLIGGCSHESHLNTVQRFDLVTCTWQPVAPMNYCRCYVSVVVHNNCIYAIGGFNGQNYFNTVECYSPGTDRWTMMASMRTKRCGASATVLNGKVYVCGGFNGRRSLTSAECYDSNTNLWTTLSPMRTGRSGVGVVAYKGRIYAVGGTVDGSAHLRTAEAYNPSTNRWNMVPSMYNPRSYFGIEVIDDQLYVIGGYDGTNTLLAVERYDEDTGMWYTASSIETSRSGLSCCLLHGLDSVVEKLFPRGPLIPLRLPNNESASEGSSSD